MISTEQPLLFTDLGLVAALERAVAEEGYTTPTPIQAATIAPGLAGRDILGCAQTGTGKTAAFVLPLLQRLAASRPSNATSDHRHGRGGRRDERGARRPIAALILSPTRELASQIAESVAAYGRHLGLTHTVIFGGVGQHAQVRALVHGVDIVVATPGRLLDLMAQGHVRLDRVEIFVLDEADRMLDMGFIAPIRRIAASVPKERQTMLFSATMPTAIADLAESLLRDPVRVAVTPVASTVDRIAQSLIMVGRAQKQSRLESLVHEHDVRRAVVFTRTKHGADRVTRKLTQAGISATAIHGNKAQNQRERALSAFRSGRARILVATDVAARGLDVDGISHVFNFDLPMEPEAYVHRIGRTGRAGADGTAISFCDPCPNSGEMDLLRQIQRLLRTSIPSHDGSPTPRLEDDRTPSAAGRSRTPNRTTRGQRGGSTPSSTGRRDGHRHASGRSAGASPSGAQSTTANSSPAAHGTPHGSPARGRGGAGGWARRTVRSSRPMR